MGGSSSKPELPPHVVNRREMVIMSTDIDGSDGGAKVRGFKVAEKRAGDANAGGLYTILTSKNKKKKILPSVRTHRSRAAAP